MPNTEKVTGIDNNEVSQLQSQILTLQSQLAQTEKALTNKTKQFDNLVSVYNLLIDKILNTGIER